MDDVLRKQAEKWQARATGYLQTGETSDPYGSYFSYFICLLIIAKDHCNHSSKSIGRGDEEQIKRLFNRDHRKILNVLRTNEISEVTRHLATRLDGINGIDGQSIIFVKESFSVSQTKYKSTVADLNELANFWKGLEAEDDPQGGSAARSRQVFTFLWQIRNNLFHGEKGYGENHRVESDQLLLNDACKLLAAITSTILAR
jgi:hypothetical protein